MDDEIAQLIAKRKKKRQKVIISFVAIMVILGVLNTIVFMLLGLFLMILGVSSSMNVGTALVELKYSKYSTVGFHDLVETDRKERGKNFGASVVLSLSGFVIFFVALYLLSVGWSGLLHL